MALGIYFKNQINFKILNLKIKKVIFYLKLAFSKFQTDSLITQTKTQTFKKLKTQNQTQYLTNTQLICLVKNKNDSNEELIKC